MLFDDLEAYEKRQVAKTAKKGINPKRVQHCQTCGAADAAPDY